jgi:UPF0716 family protein affecting phage T7 exclusion
MTSSQSKRTHRFFGKCFIAFLGIALVIKVGAALGTALIVIITASVGFKVLRSL